MELYAPEDFNEAKLLGVFESGTSEWHELRADGLGGSEMGTIMGLNPYESAFALYLKKTGQIPTPELDSFAVWRGSAYEAPLLDYFAKLHPELELFRTGTYQHPELTYLHANPDALARNRNTGEWVVVEVKTSRSYWDSGIPLHYEAQVLHYMDILGIKKAHVIGDVGSTWYEAVMLYDGFRADVQRNRASEFWSGVVNGIQPSWDGSTSTYDAVRQLHPEIDDEEVEIDGAHQLALAQAKYDAALAELNEQKSQVLALMGRAKYAYVEHEGERIRVASRQARGNGTPYLVISKGRK
jgi:putative phage-type endonuclease